MKSLEIADRSVEEPVNKTRAGIIRHRYVFCLLVFTGLALVYAMRVNLGVAIISMAGRTEKKDANISGICFDRKGSRHTDTPTSKSDFDWTPEMKNTLLEAFFNGYISTQIIGSIMAAKLSVKWVFGYGIFLTSLLTLATYSVAHWHYHAFIALRVLEGITEGVTMPSLYSLIARWAPENERTTMTTLCSIGTNIGTVITMPATAALCSSSWGWPASFYIPGAVGVVWSLLWYLCATSQPENHRWISDEEREYIIKNRGTSLSRNRSHIPWASILTSRAVWMFSFARLIASITFYMFLTEMPTFLDSVFGIPLSSNGYLNGLFYILYACSTVASGMLSDLMIQRNLLSRSNIRKLFECSSFVLSGSMLLTVTQLKCDRSAVSVVLCLASVFMALTGGGDAGLPLDLAPRVAGSVMAIGNTVGNIGAIAATRLVSYTNDPSNVQAGWNVAFTITGAISFMGAIIFAIFATAEEQPWARETNDEINFVNDAAEEEAKKVASPKRYSVEYAGMQ